MKTLLYLEDELKLAREVSQQLHSYFENLHVISAGDGTEGMRILRNKKVDVVVMDLSLPGVDGLEILNFVMHEYPDLSIIVTSTSDMILRDIGLQPFPFPFFRCLPKPFPIKNMIMDVEAALDSQPAVVIHDMSPLGVLQLMHNEGRDCKIEVMTSAGSGCFVLKERDLVTAFLGEASGQNAVMAFLKADDLSARIYFTSVQNNWVNLDTPFDALMLECCQQLDEIRDEPATILEA